MRTFLCRMHTFKLTSNLARWSCCTKLDAQFWPKLQVCKCVFQISKITLHNECSRRHMFHSTTTNSTSTSTSTRTSTSTCTSTSTGTSTSMTLKAKVLEHTVSSSWARTRNLSRWLWTIGSKLSAAVFTKLASTTNNKTLSTATHYFCQLSLALTSDYLPCQRRLSWNN